MIIGSTDIYGFMQIYTDLVRFRQIYIWTLGA